MNRTAKQTASFNGRKTMIKRALLMMIAFSCVAVVIPQLPAHLSAKEGRSRECWEIREELMDAVERGQLTWAQIRPIIKRCDKVEFK